MINMSTYEINMLTNLNYVVSQRYYVHVDKKVACKHNIDMIYLVFRWQKDATIAYSVCNKNRFIKSMTSYFKVVHWNDTNFESSMWKYYRLDIIV